MFLACLSNPIVLNGTPTTYVGPFRTIRQVITWAKEQSALLEEYNAEIKEVETIVAP